MLIIKKKSCQNKKKNSFPIFPAYIENPQLCKILENFCKIIIFLLGKLQFFFSLCPPRTQERVPTLFQDAPKEKTTKRTQINLLQSHLKMNTLQITLLLSYSSNVFKLLLTLKLSTKKHVRSLKKIWK